MSGHCVFGYVSWCDNCCAHYFSSFATYSVTCCRYRTALLWFQSQLYHTIRSCHAGSVDSTGTNLAPANVLYVRACAKQRIADSYSCLLAYDTSQVRGGSPIAPPQYQTPGSSSMTYRLLVIIASVIIRVIHLNARMQLGVFVWVRVGVVDVGHASFPP